MSPASRAWRSIVFDEIRDAVLITDGERRIVDANSAACALLGITLSSSLGAPIEEFIPVAPRDGPIAAWNRFVTVGRASGEFHRTKSDGARCTLEYRARANVAPGIHVWILRDATTRIAIDQRLIDSGARAERLQEM